MLPAYFVDFEPEDRQKERTLVISERITLLEESKVFSIGEKAHLVLLLLGRQRICDIGVGQTDIGQYEDELRGLGVAFRRMEVATSDRWIVAGFNQAILEYIEVHWEKLSEIEAGIFYGYPVTSTLAFSQILKSRTRKPETAAAFYLGGIYSKEYFDEEKEYFEKAWQEIWKVSSKIASEAEENYKNTIENEKNRLF